ncbi:hypothetical protein JCGZ_05955 [Jatropha curcas]|uniref:Uncharacterized protein n=1 Tax=Jatropha curcas TaxID=180498 RepID=A0A067KMP5_JATCU|nr:hypothetical protein JCGZ_05955 [Jatropha curcas]
MRYAIAVYPYVLSWKSRTIGYSENQREFPKRDAGDDAPRVGEGGAGELELTEMSCEHDRD